MEDEVHFGFSTVFIGDGFLSVAEDGGFEFYSARFVSAVNVAEGGRKHEAPEGIEGFVDLHHILGCGVEFFGG